MPKLIAAGVFAAILTSGCAFIMGTPENPPEGSTAGDAAPADAAPADAVACDNVSTLETERTALDASAQVDFDGSIFSCESGGVFGSAIKVGQQGDALTLTAMREGVEVALTGRNDGKTLVVVTEDAKIGIRMTFTTNAMGLESGQGEIFRNDGSGCDPVAINCK